MKRVLAVSTLILAISAVPSHALQFQIHGRGNLGMGGAGVARSTDGMSPYWNPAGLAYAPKTYSGQLNGGFGAQIGKTLAEDIDTLEEISFDAIDNSDFQDLARKKTTETLAQGRALIGDLTKAIAVLDRLGDGGFVRIEADAAFGNQIKNFGIGVYSSFEGSVTASVDTANIWPSGASSGSSLLDTLAFNLFSLAAPTSNSFFTAAQREQIVAACNAKGLNGDKAADLFDSEYVANSHGISNADATTATIKLIEAFGDAGKSLDDNTSTLDMIGLALYEVPFSYGYAFSESALGGLGRLSVGGSIKVMKGRVYKTTAVLRDEVDGSGSFEDDIRDNYKDSTAFGVNLGAMWKPIDALTVGLVANNLNSPKFDGLADSKITVDPQFRAGVNWDALPWVSLAADLDLVANDTLTPGYRSQHFGGGAELHPTEWFRLRIGIYTNLAEDTDAVATGGLTLGTKFLNIDVDGAYGLGKASYDNADYPSELKLQFAVNVMF